MKKDKRNENKVRHGYRLPENSASFNKFLDCIDYLNHKRNQFFNAIKNGSKEMAQAKNYTDEMVSEMTKRYTESPTRETVDALAKDMCKTVRSIIAKLSREGVYVAQPRTTKSGEPVISKSELVAQINEHFGIELPTLVKAGKQDLAKLVEVLNS